LEITRNGYSGREQDCKFISISHIGKKSWPEMTPVVSIATRCDGEGATWRERIDLRYSQGVLSVTTFERSR
jgi:hypothetical protein